MSLDAIRQKVWSGEVLSFAEIVKLQSAVLKKESPELGATLVQALVNEDAIEPALILVNKMLEEEPRNVQLHIAKARAYLSVEKWSEAEPALLKALEINPADPEVHKAMVLIQMRRGEFTRAKATIERLLKEDPLDSEAQQLSLELDRTEGASLSTAVPTPTEAETFRQAIIDACTRRSLPWIIAADDLLIRSGRATMARLSMATLLSEFRTSGRSLDLYVESLASELSERSLGVRAGRLHLLSRVMPVLRDDAFLEKGRGAVRREGPAGLWLFYVINDPAFIRYVPERALERSRISLDELDVAAWKNLKLQPAPLKPIELIKGALRIAQRHTGLWGLTGNDGHDAARVLSMETRELISEMLGDGPIRVYLGLRELVLLCRADNAEATAHLAQLGAADDGIAGIFEMRDGVLKPVSAWASDDVTA